MKTPLHTKILFLLFAIINLNTASAQTFILDNVKYSVITGTTNVEVISKDTKYTGDIIIPETVLNEGITYNVTAIKSYTFFSNFNLTSVTIGNSVTTIGNNAFNNCAKLTTVIIGKSVATIEIRAFESCTSLTSIIIPDLVTKIEQSIFYRCSSLTSVIIGKSVTYIDEYAFQDCSSLLSLIIPDSVTYIHNVAFAGCTSLTTLTIGKSVTHIGGSAFGLCTSLTTVNCNIETPIYASSSAFSGVNQAMCTLNVPVCSVELYQKASVWKDFNPIQGGISCLLNTDSFTNKNVSIYPNPVSNILNIDNPFTENTQLKVINNLGQIVLEQNQNTASSSLDVSMFSKGIYFLNIASQERNSQTIKFIKN